MKENKEENKIEADVRREAKAAKAEAKEAKAIAKAAKKAAKAEAKAARINSRRVRRIENKSERRAKKEIKAEKRRAKTEKPLTEDELLEKELASIAAEQRPVEDWTAVLDNAALIFPASETADTMNMFRISALMKEEVDPVLLQRALNALVPRFPTYTSSLKRGAFWFYLEPVGKPLVVEKQKAFPCRKIPMDSRHALIRITYYSHQINAEFFHVATDGNGGVTFLNSLIGEYLRLKGVKIGERINCLNALDKPRSEEMADSFHKFADLKTKRDDKDVKAYKIGGRKLPAGSLILTKGTVDAAQINSVAAARGLTVGELATTLLIMAIDKNRENERGSAKRPTVISVPVNLRRFFETKTLRNFVSVMNVSGEGKRGFDEIAAVVKRQFAEKSSMEYIQGWMNYNVKLQRNPFMKIVPLPIKMIALKIALRMRSDRALSTVFTNLGRISAPQEFAEHVARYEFSLGEQSYAPTACSAASYNGASVFCFSRTVRESNIERYFFGSLAELGVEVNVETEFEV